MFDLFFQPYTPGFRVRPQGEVPGFNIYENGLRQGEPAWFNGASPGSATPRDLASTLMEGTIGMPTPRPKSPLHPSLSVNEPGFRATTQDDMVGFPIGPQREVPGFNIERAADDRDVAWAKCHARCVAQTVGRGFGSEAPQLYRRCMRECLAESGYFGY